MRKPCTCSYRLRTSVVTSVTITGPHDDPPTRPSYLFLAQVCDWSGVKCTRDNAAPLLQHMKKVTDGSCVGQFRAASVGLQHPQTAADWSKLAAAEPARLAYLLTSERQYASDVRRPAAELSRRVFPHLGCGTGFRQAFNNNWTYCHAKHLLASYRHGQAANRGFD